MRFTVLFMHYLKRDEESVFFDFQSELSAHKYDIEFKLCTRECLSDEIVKNTGFECKRTPVFHFIQLQLLHKAQTRGPASFPLRCCCKEWIYPLKCLPESPHIAVYATHD